MDRASLGGPGSGLRAQGRGLELQVVQAGNVHLQRWIGVEGEGTVSTLLRPSSSRLPMGADGVAPVCKRGPQASPSPLS